MTGQALYDRRAELRVATLRVLFEENAGLRLQFNVEKRADSSQPNTATISVYNLNQASRNLLSSIVMPDPATFGHNLLRQAGIYLAAGYGGTPAAPATMGPIFKGTVQSVAHSREGADWVSKILAVDGAYHNQIPINISFAKGTNLAQLIGGMVDSLASKISTLDFGQLKKRVLAGDISGAIVATTKALNISGLALPELKAFIQPYNLELSVQDGELLMTAVDEVLGGVELSGASGLIGAVEPVRDEKNPGVQTLKCQSLLRHEFKIGAGVRLNSLVQVGNYKIRKLHHSGDTHGPKWLSELQMTPTKAFKVLDPP